MNFGNEIVKGNKLENMIINWLITEKNIPKECIKYVGDKNHTRDLEFINCNLKHNNKKYKKGEVKTLGNIKDYIYIETHSVIKDKTIISGWAIDINNDEIKINIKKDVLYFFPNIKNNKVIVIGGFELYNFIKNFFSIDGMIQLTCYTSKHTFSLPRIKINGKYYTQKVQFTSDKGFHSSMIQIPYNDIKNMINKMNDNNVIL